MKYLYFKKFMSFLLIFSLVFAHTCLYAAATEQTQPRKTLRWARFFDGDRYSPTRKKKFTNLKRSKHQDRKLEKAKNRKLRKKIKHEQHLKKKTLRAKLKSRPHKRYKSHLRNLFLRILEQHSNPVIPHLYLPPIRKATKSQRYNPAAESHETHNTPPRISHVSQVKKQNEVNHQKIEKKVKFEKKQKLEEVQKRRLEEEKRQQEEERERIKEQRKQEHEREKERLRILEEKQRLEEEKRQEEERQRKLEEAKIQLELKRKEEEARQRLLIQEQKRKDEKLEREKVERHQKLEEKQKLEEVQKRRFEEQQRREKEERKQEEERERIKEQRKQEREREKVERLWILEEKQRRKQEKLKEEQECEKERLRILEEKQKLEEEQRRLEEEKRQQEEERERNLEQKAKEEQAYQEEQAHQRLLEEKEREEEKVRQRQLEEKRKRQEEERQLMEEEELKQKHKFEEEKRQQEQERLEVEKQKREEAQERKRKLEEQQRREKEERKQKLEKERRLEETQTKKKKEKNAEHDSRKSYPNETLTKKAAVQIFKDWGLEKHLRLLQENSNQTPTKTGEIDPEVMRKLVSSYHTLLKHSKGKFETPLLAEAFLRIIGVDLNVDRVEKIEGGSVGAILKITGTMGVTRKKQCFFLKHLEGNFANGKERCESELEHWEALVNYMKEGVIKNVDAFYDINLPIAKGRYFFNNKEHLWVLLPAANGRSMADIIKEDLKKFEPKKDKNPDFQSTNVLKQTAKVVSGYGGCLGRFQAQNLNDSNTPDISCERKTYIQNWRTVSHLDPHMNNVFVDFDEKNRPLYTWIDNETMVLTIEHGKPIGLPLYDLLLYIQQVQRRLTEKEMEKLKAVDYFVFKGFIDEYISAFPKKFHVGLIKYLELFFSGATEVQFTDTLEFEFFGKTLNYKWSKSPNDKHSTRIIGIIHKHLKEKLYKTETF